MTQEIVFVNENTASIVSPQGCSDIKGAKISLYLQEILDFFGKPRCFDDVIKMFEEKYSAETLKRMLVCLVDNHVLITEHNDEVLRKQGGNFLCKTFFLTAGGKSLQEIIDNFMSLRIGIIGTVQLAECLVEVLSTSGLLLNFNIMNVDEARRIVARQKDVKLIYYNLYGKSQNLEEFISKCDFIFAVSNFPNHHLFNKLATLCYKKDKMWMRILTQGAYAEVGPLFVRGKTCCYACLHTRRCRNMTTEEYFFDELYARKLSPAEAREREFKSYVLYPVNNLAANIASAELMKLFSNMRCNLMNQVLTIDALNFHTQIDYIYKDYRCAICALREENV